MAISAPHYFLPGFRKLKALTEGLAAEAKTIDTMQNMPQLIQDYPEDA